MKLTTLAIAVCAAASTLAGAAYAADHPNNRAGMQGVGGVSSTQTNAVRPDDRAGLRGTAGAESVTAPSGRPDGRSLADGADIDRSQPTLVLGDRGRDWGVGAAGLFGACVLGLGLAFTAAWVRRGRGRQAAV